MGIDSATFGRIMSFNNYLQPSPKVPLAAKSGIVRFRIPSIPLVPGDYFLTPSVCLGMMEYLDTIEKCAKVHVLPSSATGAAHMPMRGHGFIWLPADIELLEDNLTPMKSAEK